MHIDLLLGYSGRKMELPMRQIQLAEELGFRAVWTAEAYGSDAVTPAAWILAQTTRLKVGTAIMQMPARSPAMAAMTAMTLSELSKGRFIVGLGASGPQVVEGWHGVPYGKPVTRLREYVSIMRNIFERKSPATYDGSVYQLPYRGVDATGLGKPLKSILTSTHEVPILAATITPAGVSAAAEVADGFFPVWMDPEKYSVFAPALNRGFLAAGKSDGFDFQVSPFVSVSMGENIEQCMAPMRDTMALYIGGMGARNKNFYNNYTKALGFEEAAIKIQDLFLSGKKDEAAAAVPAELIDACHLVGPEARIRKRLERWKTAADKGHVSAMLLNCPQQEALKVVANEMQLAPQ